MSIATHESPRLFDARRPKNIFREFLPGQQLYFDIHNPTPEGITTSQQETITIGAIAGGGFFGQVLIPDGKDYVIKTSVPSRIKYALRSKINNYEPFPAQHSEIAAQRTVVASRLIANALPVITDRRFVAPTAYGYTRFNQGFAYIIEKMKGRGPRYDTDHDEFTAFREAQKELTTYAYSLGLEHVGQIHPDNDFGMANLWWDPTNKHWIWLDTIPAIQHVGRIGPVHYPFHNEIRRHFNSASPTFDKIHTDIFRQTVETNREKFTVEQYVQIIQDLKLYDDLIAREVPETRKDRKTAYIALGRALADKPVSFGIKAIKNTVRVIKDPESYLTNGIDEAVEKGYITADEYSSVMHLIDSQFQKRGFLSGGWIYSGLVGYYFACGRTADAVAVYLGFDAMKDIFTESLHTMTLPKDPTHEIFQIITAIGVRLGLPPIATYMGTKLASTVTGKDMRVALNKIRTYPVPGIGYVALLAQATMGADNDIALHYQLRYMLARLSGLHPAGGPGTQKEGEMIERYESVNRTIQRKNTRAKMALGNLVIALTSIFPS